MKHCPVKKKFLIVGNSAAGTGALEAIRRCDHESSVTIVSDENYPLYSRCLLSYFVADKIEERRLQFRPPDFHREMGAELIAGKKVASVDPARQQVACSDGTRLDYDRLLIATGGSSRIPPGIPADLEGVFVFRSIADARAIREKIAGARHAVVLGGGLIGMKAAFALAHRGLQVSVVVRSSHVLSRMLDAEAAQIVMAQLIENGINVQTGADVSGIETKDNKITGVTIEGVSTKESKRLPCDLLIAAKGVEPNKELVSGTGIETKSGIVTNSKMKTGIENIFAAGDVAETFDIATERRDVNALWTCAIQQGRIAGLNMAGREQDYDGSIGMNSINFPGADLISFGVVRPTRDAGYEVMVDNRPQAGIYRKIVLKDDRIKGLILVNHIDNAGVYLSLLGRKMDVSGFKDDLLSNHFNYAQVLGHSGHEEWKRFWNAGHAVRS